MTTQTYVTTRLTTVNSHRADLDNAGPIKSPGRPEKPKPPPKSCITPERAIHQLFGIESECFKGLVFVEGLINFQAAERLIREFDMKPWFPPLLHD